MAVPGAVLELERSPSLQRPALNTPTVGSNTSVGKWPAWSWAATRAEFAKLCTPGVLGFYDHFEATELIGFRKGHMPINLFSLFVGEEDGLTEEDLVQTWLNTDRITVKGLTGWTFGLFRYAVSASAMQSALDTFEVDKVWNPSGEPLEVGPLQPLPPQFAPPDSAENLAWNRVLKNNFWNGSQILELADPEKRELAPFFDLPIRLQTLSSKIGEYLPLGLAALSDRLGNIVIQLPVTALIAEFRRSSQPGYFHVEVAWHPRATPRALRANCEIVFDGLMSAYTSVEMTGIGADLHMRHTLNSHRGLLWDDTNNVLVAATSLSAFIGAISFQTHVVTSEPRVFSVPGPDGQLRTERIGILGGTGPTTIGELTGDGNGGWTDRRLYTDEVALLTTQRRFVQYGPQNAPAAVEHARALADIRTLINEHNENGVWLWDPYLCADDILKTLFYCSHYGADLRALTAGKAAPVEKPKPLQKPLGFWGHLLDTFRKPKPIPLSAPSWVEQQKNRLEVAKGNRNGLRLEFRIKKGQEGWAFHDRFLIFPRHAGGALAWSLGASVNNLGGQHHILQKVADGQMVMDAFSVLWNALDKPDHVVWKTP